MARPARVAVALPVLALLLGCQSPGGDGWDAPAKAIVMTKAQVATHEANLATAAAWEATYAPMLTAIAGWPTAPPLVVATPVPTRRP